MFHLIAFVDRVHPSFQVRRQIIRPSFPTGKKADQFGSRSLYSGFRWFTKDRLNGLEQLCQERLDARYNELNRVNDAVGHILTRVTERMAYSSRSVAGGFIEFADQS